MAPPPRRDFFPFFSRSMCHRPPRISINDSGQANDSPPFRLPPNQRGNNEHRQIPIHPRGGVPRSQQKRSVHVEPSIGRLPRIPRTLSPQDQRRNRRDRKQGADARTPAWEGEKLVSRLMPRPLDADCPQDARAEPLRGVLPRNEGLRQSEHQDGPTGAANPSLHNRLQSV